MTIFKKLFATYVLVTLLAVVVSGGFASYLAWQSAGNSQMSHLEAYGRDLAALLEDKEWGAKELAAVQSTAETLDRSDTAHVLLVDRNGVVQWASKSVAKQVGTTIPTEEQRAAQRGRPDMRWMRPRPDEDGDRTRMPSIAVPVFRNKEVAGTIVLRPALAPIQRIRYTLMRFTLYGSLGVALVLALISYLLSRRLARPLEQVSAAARRVGQGDFSSRVTWQSNDEVGKLAESFNQMAGELELLEMARKELIANVSHELKGPLARVSGYLEAIKDGAGGESARAQHFEIVRREVGRLTRLVNDLLDYSRLEVGRLKLHPFPCDLAPTLHKAVQVFQGMAAQSGVELAEEIPGALPIVECEPERIEQVLVNLLENALSFTPRGGRVSVATSESEGWLELTVTDTGPGIPPEELGRIFDRFYKLDPARTPDRRGFGLGLTIVRQLVELHGGEVFATSEIGKGSCFGFRLPLATPH
ncbi:MAG TPA: HAMP domain-containing sensor histidine kinase [Symbiobacteriaceae bacterium]|nr:HAMP domain-containing sensor histidine kinase [Symbiobacteriaceae bacterium]